jgi:Na+-driven multidrug efflux pump
MIAIIPAALFWIAKSTFRAMGDTVTPLMVTAFDIVLTIALEFALCFKPFHLGVSGIGISWIVANVAALIWTLVNLRRTPLAGCLRIFDSFSLTNSKEWFVRFMKIGLPGSIQESGIILGVFGVVAVLSATHEPTINQAAWSAGWRIEEVAVLLPTFAFNITAATLIGQNLGAKNIIRAENAVWCTMFMCVAVYLLFAALLWSYAPQAAKFMSANFDVAKSSVGYFRLLALSSPFFAAFTVLAGAMQGAGYASVPMMIAVFCFFFLRTVGAWYFALVLHLDATGAWIAMSLPTVVAGILAVIAFKLGRWKYQTV